MLLFLDSESHEVRFGGLSPGPHEIRVGTYAANDERDVIRDRTNDVTVREESLRIQVPEKGEIELELAIPR